MFLIKMCERCTKNNSGNWNAGDINGFFEAFSPDDNICPYCHGILIDTNLLYDEFRIIKQISSDTTFMEAVISLKEKDPIEYQLKMSQFRNQVVQQKQSEQLKQESKPHCPHCHSTNIKSLSGLNRGTSIAMWGIFSKKINKSFECIDCKYTW